MFLFCPRVMSTSIDTPATFWWQILFPLAIQGFSKIWGSLVKIQELFKKTFFFPFSRIFQGCGTLSRTFQGLCKPWDAKIYNYPNIFIRCDKHLKKEKQVRLCRVLGIKDVRVEFGLKLIQLNITPTTGFWGTAETFQGREGMGLINTIYFQGIFFST